MWSLLAPLVTWVFRLVVVKFGITSVLYVILTELLPFAIAKLFPTLGAGDGGLTLIFGGFTPMMWYLFDYCQGSYGIPMVISAGVGAWCFKRLHL